jgi:hypothetical protein
VTDQEQLKYAHRDRVVDACALAIRHAALLLSPSMQKLADELLKDDPRKLQARKREAVGADLSLILALEKLFRLRTTNAWVAQHHYIGLLTDCWVGVAERRDRELRNDGSLGLAEQEYQQTVVKPMIQRSFETLWAAQADLKKQQKKVVEAS